MTQVKVENIIVSFSVSSSLDLPKLAEAIPEAQYNPADVPELILQFPNPRSMAAVSATGTVKVTGPKTMDEILDVVKMIIGRLNILGGQLAENPEIAVQNVTISTDLNQKVNLRNLSKFLQITKYAPRDFPGLIYKTDDPNTVILLFDSGKIVCNGITIEEATVALNTMVEKLSSFGINMEENICQK